MQQPGFARTAFGGLLFAPCCGSGTSLRRSPQLVLRWPLNAFDVEHFERRLLRLQLQPEPVKNLESSTGRDRPSGCPPPSGHELFYFSPDLKLMQVSLKRGPDSIEPSAPQELFALPVANDGYCPDEIAPDGQRFLVRATPEKQVSQPLTLIVNWPALIKKEAAAQ